MTMIDESGIAALRFAVRGPVFQRGDDSLAAEASGFNAITAHDPDLVVGATCESDVQAAVRYAVAHESPVFVQATGHGANQGVAHGVLVLTRRMDSVSIDPDTRIASSEGRSPACRMPVTRPGAVGPPTPATRSAHRCRSCSST